MRFARKWIGSAAVLVIAAGLSGLQASVAGAPKKGPVKVFILAGDSNCEGKAATKHLEYLIDNPETAATYKHLRTADGKWAVRDDVWIRYLARKGNLTVGYGGAETQFGIELQFGNVLGNHVDNQILLIKTAWGGSGLGRNFASPSSGGTPGKCYTDMIENVKDTLKNMKTLFPDYDEAGGYEVAGFVWFSGWNDAGMKDYEEKLANLIKDVRKDLNALKMLVVIGELGVGGPTQPGKENPMRKFQAAVAERAEFKDTIKYVKTAEYYDKKAEAMFRDGSWKKKETSADFYKIASDRPFHYMGSGKTFFLMGNAIGEGMVELLQKK